MSFFENTRKPAGFGGRVMVSMMNPCHSPMDCGCGANLARLLKKCPGGIEKAAPTGGGCGLFFCDRRILRHGDNGRFAVLAFWPLHTLFAPLS